MVKVLEEVVAFSIRFEVQLEQRLKIMDQVECTLILSINDDQGSLKSLD